MANKTKKEKEPAFSEIKNSEKPIKVIQEEELPETRQMIKIDKMDMPLTTVSEAMKMWQQYQDLINALIKENDVVEIQGKKRVKKSGVNKIARFFGYSCEIIRTKKEDVVGPQGGKQFIWYAWVKAIAPNGRFRVEGAACSSTERRFAHLYHDVFAMAITRASNRAIQELAGMGELEFDEGENNTERKPKEKSEFKYEKYEFDGKEYMRAIKDGQIIREGIEPDEWKPLFRPHKFSKGFPSNDKMPISSAVLNWIKVALARADINVEDKMVFILNNRADGLDRTKELNQLNKGDGWDITETIKRKGKEGLLSLIAYEGKNRYTKRQRA